MGAERGRRLGGRIGGAIVGVMLGALLGLGALTAGAQSGLEAGKVGAGAPYPAVTAGVVPVFPRDHGAHPEFRTEWWYITGWLADEKGVERGFQLTFFRVRPRIAEGGRSRFNPTQLVLAHAAVADPAHGRLLHAERAERILPPLVSADTAHTAVQLRDWSLVWVDAGGAPAEVNKGGEVCARDERWGGPGDSGGYYRARIQSAEFAYDLQISPTGEPVLNGIGGYSQKAPGPEHASYYYSRPQLAVVGNLSFKGASHAVRGTAWLDHEWSSEIMPPSARGWDWIGINLHDGSSLMAFRMRGADDAPIWAAATLRSADGRIRVFKPDEVRFIPRRQWRSPRSGASYPVEWSLQLAPGAGDPGRSLRIAPLMDDQELDSRRSTGAIYWEGAVRLYEGEGEQGGEREIGKGYLEMTGYVERLQM